ncbi:hypothetical protein KY320_03275 [Candidatus Woesearchaeota archaeon]|nr:hypothetical protein [Candidatus Woesearchaeota archaeon]
MDKKILFGILFVSLFVIGCTVEQPEPVVPEKESEPVVVDQEPEVTEVQPEPEPPQLEMSEELLGILAKNDRVQRLEYTFKDSDGTYKAYIDGNRQKILYAKIQRQGDFEYNSIYLDAGKRTAYLACITEEDCEYLRAIEVDYGDFEITTPLQVVNAMEYGEITERPQLDNKNTVVVSYTNPQGNAERMWLWDYWGVPLQREITSGGKKSMIVYGSLVVNGAVDVELPKRIEII